MTDSDEAVGFIKTHCPTMGSYFGDGAPHKLLAKIAVDMAQAKATVLFPDRYKEHVAYALWMVASNLFLDPPAAVASVYLATRFEFYFRILSGKLKGDGTWVNQAVDQQAAIARLGSKGLGGQRVSDVAITYKLMKLNQPSKAAQIFDSLDKAIFPTPHLAPRSFTVADIGDRIAYGRHNAGHGELGDISSDAVFYGLVTTIIFCNQS